RACVEVFAGAHAQDHPTRVEASEGSECLRHDRGVIAKRRRGDRGPERDRPRALAGGAEPGERERGMAVGVAPRLEVVADEHRVEATEFSRTRKPNEHGRSELLGRSLVAEPKSWLQSAPPAVALPAE